MTMMNASKAVRNFYRISLKLTKDIARAEHQSHQGVSCWAPTALISQALQEYQQTGETSRDVRSYVQSSFRKRNETTKQRRTEDKHHTKIDKEQIEAALQGIRRLETLLMDIQSAPRGITSKGIDDSWTASMVNQVEWLRCLTPATASSATNNDNNNIHKPASHKPSTLVGDHGTSTEQEYSSSVMELPMIPLTQPFFALNESFHLFTRFSPWEFPMPGDDDIELYIREPRYLDLYIKSFSTFSPRQHHHQHHHKIFPKTMLTQTAGFHTTATPYTRHFVVPFAHPHEHGTFAKHGLLMEVTDWRSTRGPAGLVLTCQHAVSHHPVHIHGVVNPRDWDNPETHLRAQVTLLDTPKKSNTDWKLCPTDRDPINQALQKAVEANFAAQCQTALQQEGVWGFLVKFQSFLQQSIQQLELHLGHRVLLAVREKRKQDANADASSPLPQETLAGIIDNVHKPFRYRLLKLKLALSMSIPRVLQAKSDQDRKDVLLDLISSLS